MIFNKKSKTCLHVMEDGDMCGRDLFDHSCCVFHSKDVVNKKKVFNDHFWKEWGMWVKEKDKDIIDCTGFIFPASIHFHENAKQIDKKISFNRTIFFGPETSFKFVKFMCDVDFSYAEFRGESAFFIGTEFRGGYAWFEETKFFTEITGFDNALFKTNEVRFTNAIMDSKRCTSFKKAIFPGSLKSFNGARFSGEETSFSETEFSGSTTEFCDVQFMAQKTDFNGAIFRDRLFKKARINIFNCYCDDIHGLFEALRNKGFRRLLNIRKYKIKDFRFHLGEKSGIRYPVIKRMMSDAWYLADFKEQHPIIYSIWNVTSKCGESILRWSMWSSGLALYFALNYYWIYLADNSNFYMNPEMVEKTLWTFIYYSMVTFTTLGFGDIAPTKNWVQHWVTIEVILGYVMLGGLISIFANKLARRS